MDNAALVCRLQACGHPLHQRLHCLERQRAVVLYDRRKRAAVDEFHGQVGPLQHRLDREYIVAHDRIVLQVVQGGGFPSKQRERGFVLGQFRQHQLDRDRVAGLDGVALVDFSHAADADLAVDLIDAIEARAGRDPRPRKIGPGTVGHHPRSSGGTGCSASQPDSGAFSGR